jgi:hypothetical protein
MSTGLPPQRRQGGAGGGGPRGGGSGRALTPAQGAEEAERRLGRPCYHAGQRVSGIYACVACQFRINNRKALPSCPDCGELVWAFMGEGERPVPEGEEARPAAAAPAEGPRVEDGVKLDAPAPVKVEEGVKLDP